MQEVISRHRQDFGEIRRLCLICHGLDYSANSFLRIIIFNNNNMKAYNYDGE